MSSVRLGKWLANLGLGAFYMVGDIESARAKGEKILADLDKS